MNLRLYVLALALLTTHAVGAAPLGEPVSLGPAESATFDELALTFEGIDGDNRCPRDVDCFVAGKATVVLVVGPGEDPRTTLRVNVPPGRTAKTSYDGYEIEISVAPEPVAGKAIDPDDYVVTLIVSR